ncbi:MAG: cytochrome P450 [Mycobacteriaceae bacterium]|nr:cytochrome P450 [Mycobacteriaceae bacterium]
MSDGFAHASLLEGIRFTAQVGAPQLLVGQFKKRDWPSRIASAVGADYGGYLLVNGLVEKYGPQPFYVRLARDEILLVHDPDDIRFVLQRSPEPFAPDPDSKRKGMVAFQPNALTLSRGDLWADRRRFAEAVLDTKRHLHRLASTFRGVAYAEADAMAERPLRFTEFNAAFQRLTRRVVFGEAAAEDCELTAQLGELMAVANGMPGEQAPDYADFIGRVQAYLDNPAPGSLAALVAKAPVSDRTRPAGQVVHWLFAMGDTLAVNAFRALAVISACPQHVYAVQHELAQANLESAKGIASLDYLAGCLFEAMRLWPTTPLFGRVAISDVRFPSGQMVPAGTQIFIYNVFNHRDRARIPYADEFSPNQWVSGDAPNNWSFNFFSNGPHRCPGAGLAVYLGQAVLARLLHGREPKLTGADLSGRASMPHSLDVHGLTIELTPRR